MTSPKLQNQDWYYERIQPHEELIRHWISSRYGDYCDVDDVLQETLLKVLQAREKTEIASPKAFFFSVARNVAVNHIRKSKVRAADSIDDESFLDMIDEEMRVDEIAARNHELEILTKAIQSLPQRCQQIFTLSKVYGMSYKRISKELGISFHTVSSQITIGLSKCTKYMNQNGRN